MTTATCPCCAPLPDHLVLARDELQSDVQDIAALASQAILRLFRRYFDVYPDIRAIVFGWRGDADAPCRESIVSHPDVFGVWATEDPPPMHGKKKLVRVPYSYKDHPAHQEAQRLIRSLTNSDLIYAVKQVQEGDVVQVTRDEVILSRSWTRRDGVKRI